MPLIVFGVMLAILVVILHIFLATGVAKDIAYLHEKGGKPLFASGTVWVMAVLILGLWALLIYWLIHHSNLAR